MKKSILLIACTMAITIQLYAQEEPETDKKFEHYVGVQMNELIRSLFNINKDQLPGNPYFIQYAFNSVTSGWGLNVGVGYSLTEFTDEISAFEESENTVQVASFRIGPERKFLLGKRWIAALGTDFLYELSTNEKVTTTADLINQTETVSTTNYDRTSIGFAIRGAIHYTFGKHIMLGTESNFSFRSSTTTEKTNNVSESTDHLNIGFTSPVVLNLTVRF